MKVRLALAVSSVGALALGAATPAFGGTYRTAVCHDGFEAGGAAAGPVRSTDHYALSRDCTASGLTVTHDANSTDPGAYGGWRVTAPSGTTFTRVGLEGTGQAEAGHQPQILIEDGAGQLSEIPGVGGPFERLNWTGSGAVAIQARLVCAAANNCGRGDEASVAARRIMLTIDDGTAPSVTPAGALFAPGSKRGALGLEPTGTDSGGGVRRFFLFVNGQPVNARDVECGIVRGVGIGVSPCPATTSAAFGVDTTAKPFIQGVNRVRVCVNDLALNSSPNTTCRQRTVRVDNACPVAGELGVARLDAQWDKKGGRVKTVRKRRGATLVGRVRGATGQGVAGIPLCVGVRRNKRGAHERVVETSLLTKPDGRFRFRVPPKRYTREVRIANWPSEAGSFERRLMLKTK